MRLGIFVMFFLMACLGHAAVPADTLTASKVFADMPLDVLELLRPSTRLDMLDYYNQADSILTATDALGGRSRLVDVTDDYLKVEVTPVSTLEIRLLSGAPLFMTLYTVGGEGVVKDTEIRFFDSAYTEIPVEDCISAPTLGDFFNLKGSEIKYSELKEMLPFTTIEYTTGPGDAPLTATFTALETLSDENKERLRPLLTGPLVLRWNNKRFRMGK